MQNVKFKNSIQNFYRSSECLLRYLTLILLDDNYKTQKSKQWERIVKFESNIKLRGTYKRQAKTNMQI